MKKSIALLLTIVMVFIFTPSAFASEDDSPLTSGKSEIIKGAAEILDSTSNTQTITVSEKEIVSKMIKDGSMTRETLNERLEDLSNQSKKDLQQNGYNNQQIEVIRNYEKGEDAFDYVFNSNARAGATLTFRYGLAGTNTRKSVLLAYEMIWSSCPLTTFTDSFGVGWVAANKNSLPLATKTDSATGAVEYYTVDGKYMNYHRNISMKTPESGVLTGNPIIGRASGGYGKHIGGAAKISTQSGSSNLDTIQVFVSYAHSTVSIESFFDVTIEWKKMSTSIRFTPRLNQNIITEGNHTFKYNNNDIAEA
ncbi:hypothetical protein [Emergencia sp.]|uniref:hypothetical protein n=1 Tax=Emergencia sp. TaxID=1926557 RepID=UPI003AF17721